MKQRDLVQILTESGYQLIRSDGDHLIFKKPGARLEQVPKHREINERLAQSIINRVRRQ